MKAVFYSNKGFVREHNEDALFVAGNIISGCSMTAPVEIDTKSPDNCFVVIDGMGGYEGGEQAARIVAASFIENSCNWNISTSATKEKINSILNNAIQKITNIVNDKPELAAMGAALAGMTFCNDGILAFNCGDCRVYRQQGQYLERLSHDHSIVQELFDKGEIEEDDMRTHPRKNTITACISSDISYMNIYSRDIPLSLHQKFLICSDGVWEALSINELEACLSENSLDTANNLTQKLLSLQDECRDNISFIIVEI